MILRAISPDDYFLKRVPDTATRRPMIYAARQYFAKYRNHPAVAETQRLQESLQDIGGVLFQGVLYAEELPGTKMIHEPAPGTWQTRKEELAKYMQLLGSFYKEANVEGFFKQQEAFYNGAIAEARQYINDSSIIAMENYFGKTNEAYNLYLLPMSPYGWGFSLTTPGSKGNVLHAIVSPVTDIVWDKMATKHDAYGFGGQDAKEHYNTLVIHEFTHAFITDVLLQDTMKKQIARYDSLYTPLLDSLFGEEGYSGWWDYMNEHIVRVAHIRVANTISKADADELRAMEDNGNHVFSFIADAEELTKAYEYKRESYKTFDDFLPQLVAQFGRFSKQEVNSRLSKAK